MDDAVDDILYQSKGVSDGLMSKVSRSPSSSVQQGSFVTSKNLAWNVDDINKLAIRRPSMSESADSFSDNDAGDKDLNLWDQDVEAASQSRGWNSDRESTSKGLPQKVVKHDTYDMNFHSDEIQQSLWLKSTSNSDRYLESNLATTYIRQDALTGVPTEVLLISFFCRLLVHPSPHNLDNVDSVLVFKTILKLILLKCSFA